jgi:hypothetical protein
MHLQEAGNFFRHWFARVLQGMGEPHVLHLPCFNQPQTLLAALMQQHSRTLGIPLDKLVAAPEALGLEEDTISAPSKKGMYLGGLWIEGACYRRDGGIGTLQDVPPNELWSLMPIVEVQVLAVDELDQQKATRLHPTTFANPNPSTKEKLYPCPVYRTLNRSGASYLHQQYNYIMSVELNPGVHTVDYWVKRGVAIVASISQ